MKRALVLSGGGSRGAYEIGAWQALSEINLRIDAVYGASVGAINAALVAQGDLDMAVGLWEHIDIRQILSTGDEEFSVASMAHRKRDVIPFLLENAKNLRMDIAPLEKLVRGYLDEGKVRASGLTLGLTAVRVPQLQPVAMRLSDMEQGALGEWLLASASCFPIFPTRRIGGERYIDGGYCDNLPIDLALADGADEVVAVDVHPQHTHPEYARMPFLTTVQPLRSLGGFLDFKPRLLRRARRMGYFDALKAYGRLDGVRYAFAHQSDLHLAGPARRFVALAARFDAETIRRGAFQSGQPVDAPLSLALGRETPGRALSWKQTYLRGLELCAACMGLREDVLYDPVDLSRRLLTCVRDGSTAAFGDAGVRRDGQALVGRILDELLRQDPPALPPLSAGHPDETASALYLYCFARSME